MDDLLLEFLTETNESLDVVDVELVKFEQDPNNAQILDNIFRLVHTIKGTCGFLGLPRLESLAHAAETLMGKYRDGCPVTTEGVSLILLSIDRLKAILADLEASGSEPSGDDQDLISELERMAIAADNPEAAAEEVAAEPEPEPESEPEPEEQREVRVGEVPLDELDRIFNETESDYDAEAAAKQQMEEALAEVNAGGASTEAPAEAEKTPEPVKAEAPKAEAKPAPAKPEAKKADAKPGAAAEAKPAGEKSLAAQSIRVSVDTLENLMTMVSELVLTRNQLLEIVRRHEDSEFKVPLQRLSNVTAELQEGVMQTRMQPIGNAWQKLPRIVRDLAGELGKDIELEMVGAETELDRQVLDLIKDPLTHMVRNSADHGLEMPADRAAVGKPEKGTIKLAAYHEGGHIIIEIADDGKGLPTELLKNKAIDNELYTEAEIDRMSEAQIHKLIFHPGLSTAAKVTNVSGRGVGMDVVRTNIEAIGGTIDLKSKEGSGTVVMIKIPLTLAIVSTLIVESSGERFAIPQLAVVELVRAQKDSEHKIETIRNTPVLRLRDKLLPLSPLSHLLGVESSTEGDSDAIGEEGFIVVMQVGNQTFGLVVDAVFHTEEIVVKPMSSMLRHLSMFSGNTILGDGSVIMILDPNGIANAIGSAIDSEVAEEAGAQEAVAETSEAQSVSLLVFRAGGEEPKAVMLSLVTRLEELQSEAIETANGRHLVQYRGHLMPLVKVNEDMEIRETGTQPMLVFADEHRSMGLVVDEIVDIVDEVLDIEVTSEKPGLLGSAVIKGKATEVIDVGYFMPLAFDDWFMMKDSGSVSATFDVLLVDDSSFFRNMLAPVLRSAGYTVTTCCDAQEALELLDEGRQFDAIVSDIEMPGLSGYEFTTQVRKDSRYADTPIIAMSAHATPAAIEKGRSAGFSDYVAKFDRTGLIAAIKEQTSEVELAA